jgi:hypothetical protein
MCHPGDGADADPLAATTPPASAAIRNALPAAAGGGVRWLREARGAPGSPILESIALFARATGGTRTPRRIILVSDLLQNTGSLSLYRGQPDVDAALGTHGGRRLAAVGLAGAAVDLVDPQWHARAGRDSDERLCFWRELPARVGADVRLARPVRCAPRAVPRASP